MLFPSKQYFTSANIKGLRQGLLSDRAKSVGTAKFVLEIAILKLLVRLQGCRLVVVGVLGEKHAVL